MRQQTHKVVLLGEGAYNCGCRSPAVGVLSVATLALPVSCVVCPGRVGKTSLLLRYVTNVFSDTQPATIQASYLTKRVTANGSTLSLAIWDTAGQERFHALGPIYYRDADGAFPWSICVAHGVAPPLTRRRNCGGAAALLVFDITDTDSFDRVKAWVKELRQMAGAWACKRYKYVRMKVNLTDLPGAPQARTSCSCWPETKWTLSAVGKCR